MTPANQRLARAGAVFLHLLRLLGFALLLSTLLLLFALLVVGLPEHLTGRITEQLAAADIPLRFDSVRLSTHRGWVLNNARFYSKNPDDLQPLFSAKKLYVWAWPRDWKNLEQTDWHVKIFVRNLSVSLGRAWDSALPEKHPFRTIRKLKATLTAGSESLTLDRSSLYWGGINIETHGSITFPVIRSSDANRRRAALALDALSRLKFEESPELTLDFTLNTAHPEKTILNAQFSAEGFIWNGNTYDRISGDLTYKNRILEIADLRLMEAPDEEAFINGTFNPANSNALLSVVSSLAVADLFNLLPNGLPPILEKTGFEPFGPLRLSATLGPAPLSRLAEKMDVQIQQARVRRNDLLLDPLAFHLLRDGNRLVITNIQARANGGPFAGNLSIDLSTKAWTARTQTQCDPAPVGTLVGGGLQKFLQRFEFPQESPQADLTLSRAGTNATLVVTGDLLGTRFRAGGVTVGKLETSLTYSNRWLDLTDLHITRDDNHFDGRVQVDLVNQLGFFNATNSFPPTDVVHALAPGRTTILDHIRFDGPIASFGSGQIDYGHETNHALRATFRGEQIGNGKITADHFQSNLLVDGTQLLFTNATAQLYTGTVEGSAQFDLFTTDGAAPYRLDAQLNRLDFAQLLRAISSADPGQTQGELSGAVSLSADTQTGFWNSVQGRGNVTLQNGHLADIPLFGGFSWLLRSTFPAFNVFALNSFSADYELHDGAIYSSSAKLGGTLLSATGRGKWSPDKGLDFIVIAEPLRQTREDKAWYQVQLWAADMLKLSTAPLFYLLEFRLEGPLNKPDWRFVNLPR